MASNPVRAMTTRAPAALRCCSRCWRDTASASATSTWGVWPGPDGRDVTEPTTTRALVGN